MKLYILTSKEHSNFYFDDKKLPQALEAKGWQWQLAIWDEDTIPDGATVLIRTIWDYTEKADKFRELLQDFKQRGIKVINPIETIEWNMDKSYLVELEKSGVRVVPTSIAKCFDNESIANSKIPFPLVVKPLVGASGRDTFLLDNADFKTDISNLNGREVMIQPFMKEIQGEGEISFLYFANKFSHAVIKSSKEDEFRIQEEHGGSVKEYKPSSEELADIEGILSGITYEWSYARVDVVRDNGKFYLMELELIEPELFFRFSENGEQSLIDSLN
jgi:glutathione synthase/RimK-type ligase-like ATP-grasp enzyme